MTRLKRIAERIREGAEGFTKSLEGLPAWKSDHGEVGCTKERLRRKCRFWCLTSGRCRFLFSLAAKGMVDKGGYGLLRE